MLAHSYCLIHSSYSIHTSGLGVIDMTAGVLHTLHIIFAKWVMGYVKVVPKYNKKKSMKIHTLFLLLDSRSIFTIIVFIVVIIVLLVFVLSKTCKCFACFFSIFKFHFTFCFCSKCD